MSNTVLPLLQDPNRHSPLIMGVLNVTPDSFSDGGQFNDLDHAVRQAETMAQCGADIIDIGGESARPGAANVGVQEELDRVLPVVEALQDVIAQPISIDTRHAPVMSAAVAAGAQMINDVAALQGAQALQVASSLQVPVCLMHMQGEPGTMQDAPTYHNVVEEIASFLQARAKACVQAGIPHSHIVLDPGFGFGKTFAHNLQLLRGLQRFQDLGYPVLAGLSRKTWIGIATGKPASERVAGSVAAALLAAQNGANIIRVHDVDETHDMLKILQAYNEIS